MSVMPISANMSTSDESGVQRNDLCPAFSPFKPSKGPNSTFGHPRVWLQRGGEHPVPVRDITSHLFRFEARSPSPSCTSDVEPRKLIRFQAPALDSTTPYQLPFPALWLSQLKPGHQPKNNTRNSERPGREKAA